MQACAFTLSIGMTLQVKLYLIAWCIGCTERKERTTPFGVKLLISQALYWAAQA